MYSAILDGETISLFARFLNENRTNFQSELSDLNQQLHAISNFTGAREEFFEKYEGNKSGEDIWALYDKKKKKLRLYFWRATSFALVLGGGGNKPKNIIKLKEDPKLLLEQTLIRQISQCVEKRIFEKELKWNGFKLDGNLFFDTEDI